MNLIVNSELFEAFTKVLHYLKIHKIDYIKTNDIKMIVDGLENDRIYYFKVESVIGGYAQLPSRIIMAIPFNSSTVMPGAIYGQTIYGQGTYQNG